MYVVWKMPGSYYVLYHCLPSFLLLSDTKPYTFKLSPSVVERWISDWLNLTNNRKLVESFPIHWPWIYSSRSHLGFRSGWSQTFLTCIHMHWGKSSLGMGNTPLGSCEDLPGEAHGLPGTVYHRWRANVSFLVKLIYSRWTHYSWNCDLHSIEGDRSQALLTSKGSLRPGNYSRQLFLGQTL